jgi:anti-sigma factor RsiW
MLDRDDDLARRARKWVEETALAAQGLSVHLTDPVTLRRIATIFGWDEPTPNNLGPRSTRSHLTVRRKDGDPRERYGSSTHSSASSS